MKRFPRYLIPVLPIGRLSVFFLLFFFSLIIPDGIQQGSDFYWPLITVLTIPLWKTGMTLKAHTTWDRLLWIFLGVAIVANICVSWSPGYSISGVIRLLTGIIWLRRCSSLTAREMNLLPQLLSLFVLGAVLLSVVPILFPHMLTILPAFSLVHSPEGHLPMIYIIIPLLPILLYSPLIRRPLIRAAIVSLMVCVWLSVSRVALLITLILFGLAMILYKRRGAFVLVPIIVSLFFFIAIPIITSLPPHTRELLPIPSYARWYVVKEPLMNDQRWAYVQQGLRAVQSQVFFGTGIQTFSLVSKRFGSTPFAVSTFTHNIALNILTETGVVGCILTILVIGRYGLRLLKKKDSFPILLALGTMLVLGLTETFFDHYPVWILSMFLVGMTGVVVQQAHGVKRKFSFMYLILIVFILSWMSSDVASTMGNFPAAFLLAPYREAKAIQLFHTPLPVSPKLSHLATRLHPTSDQVLIARANKTTNERAWQTLMAQAMAAYPTNSTIQWAYLMHITQSKHGTDVCSSIQFLVSDTSLPCTDTGVISVFTSPEFALDVQELNGIDGKAKFLYAVGLELLKIPGQDINALPFFIRARDISPQWGYFHIEVASVIAQINKNKRSAIPSLLYCLSYPQPRQQCDGYLHDIEALPLPGTFLQEIRHIPLPSQ